MAYSQYDQFLQEGHTHDPAHSRAMGRNGLYGPSNRGPFLSLTLPGPGNAVRTAAKKRQADPRRAGLRARGLYAADNMRANCLDLA